MKNLSTQIATTREQSERLLAMGVKPETADMCYNTYHDTPDKKVEVDINHTGANLYIDRKYIPAWSLSRLISIMPHYIYSIPYHLSVSHGLVKYTHPKVGDKIGWCMNNIFDNCVSMIDWLIKFNLLNKEYLKGDNQ